MAFPSCCILTSDTVGADVGINVGADIEEDIHHYLSFEIVRMVMIIVYQRLLLDDTSM